MNMVSALRLSAFTLALATPGKGQALLSVAAVMPVTAPMIIDATSSSGSTSPVQPAKEQKALTARWLDLKTLSHDERYRNAYSSSDFHLFEDGQQRSLFDGRVKLDRQGRYAIGIRASSGRYFNWAYADYAGQGIGARKKNPAVILSNPLPQIKEILTARVADRAGFAELSGLVSNGWEFYMRELYFSATPVKPVTVEFGSFGIERGFSTEITTFDDDGYLSGERIRFHDPKHLFFDQIGYTNAFFGDIATPNFLDRGASLKTFNYRQVFAKKQLTKRVGFSGEYTWQLGTDTLRQAVAVGTEELRVVDKIHVEVYERLNTVNLQGLNVAGASGFALAASKRAGKYVSGDFGFASVDKDYSVYRGSRSYHAFGFSLNGDTYGQGQRFFTHAAVKVNPVVTAFGFYTHAVGTKVLDLNQQGLNAGLNFDLKALANTGRRIF